MALLRDALQAADDRVYPLEDLVEKLEAAGSKRNLVLVDACRAATGRAGRRAAVAGMRAAEEDFNLWGSQRVVRDSLMRSDAVRNSFLRGDTLLCHACSKLQTAKDGTPGKNGVFTGALLKVGCAMHAAELPCGIERVSLDGHCLSVYLLVTTCSAGDQNSMHAGLLADSMQLFAMEHTLCDLTNYGWHRLSRPFAQSTVEPIKMLPGSRWHVVLKISFTVRFAA